MHIDDIEILRDAQDDKGERFLRKIYPRAQSRDNRGRGTCSF